MKLYYLFDHSERDRLCSEGLDYTPAYFPPLAAYLGITLCPIAPDELCQLTGEDLLFVGASYIDRLPDCKVILMGTSLEAPPIPSRRERRVFAKYLLASGQTIPLFAPISAPQTCGKTLTYAFTADGEKVPALIKGEHSFEFCFDLLASVWFSGDGFVTNEPSDYFFIGRTPDTRPLLDAKNTEPFNDLLLSELENALCDFGIPMLWKLPPTTDSGIPDLAIHFSGDDDCSSLRYNVDAALTMEARGLPYHINAMPARGERFVMTKEQFDEIRSHGCEIALHTDFTDGVNYNSQSLGRQVELFEKTFGIHPITNTNHCFIQGGSTAERMRFFEEHGILADNGKMGEFDPTDINAFDLCGFGFGTAFPRFTCDDVNHQNRPIGSMEIPIPYYEPRLESDDSEPSKIIGYLENGARYGRYLQFFIHPHYLALKSSKRPAVLRALDVIQKHLDKMGSKVLYCTTNQIATFWKQRAETVLEKCEGGWEITCNTPLLIRLPHPFEKILLDGKYTSVHPKTLAGKSVFLLPISPGKHRFSFETSF